MSNKQSFERLSPEIMPKVGAIVLGGGQGTRLFPLTAVRAKPAVPLAGRYRLVDIPLSNCIHSGITRIVVLTQFNSHSLNRHINNAYRFDTFTRGYVEVLSAEQTYTKQEDWFEGTADAVRKQLLHIKDLRSEYYVILSGDQLYRMDYRQLLATHFDKQADITVAALPVSRKDAQSFGVMRVHKDGRIKEFVEKPKDPKILDALVTPTQVFKDAGLKSTGKPHLASMGVYVFKASVLEEMLLAHPDWKDFGKDVLPNALKSHKIVVHMFSGFWEDIGTVRSYFDVSMKLTSNTPPFRFNDQKHQIFTHLRALPGVKIEDAKISNSIICEGTRITRATIKNAIIGIRSIVHPGASISNSILLGAEFFEDKPKRGQIPMGIGEDAKIHNAIIDHNARIGKGVIIKGSTRLKDCQDEKFCIRDGIVVVLKNAVIRSGTVIG